MKNSYYILLLSLLLATTSQTTSAYWPTSVEEHLAVANIPDTTEAASSAILLHDERMLVVFAQAWTGNYYQIIDRFGQLQYTQYQPLTPGYLSGNHYAPQLHADGNGGAVAGWKQHERGLVAQRLDSLGNILWGDEGVVAYPNFEDDFATSSDGEGGMFFAIAVNESASDWTDLYIQHILDDGSLPWGATGIPLIVYNFEGQYNPTICTDGNGGGFVTWIDDRPPYSLGALLAQHFDENGDPLWVEDLFIGDGQPPKHNLFPDGEGGFILHLGGISWETAIRYDGSGEMLWLTENICYNGKMAPGESGYWYTGHSGYNNVYAQRIDLLGNLYWPPFYPGFGAAMFEREGWSLSSHRAFAYAEGEFAGIFHLNPTGDPVEHLFVQSLDTLGNKLLGDYGVLLAQDTNPFSYLTIQPGVSGYTAVFDIDSAASSADNVYAKHVTPYGTLGGPFPIIPTLTPSLTSIQIPPAGGSFTFDVALADSDSVGGLFDAWIDVILPTGSSLDLILRSQLNMPPDGELNRSDMTQYVPAAAPTGNYTYSLKAGYYPNSIWSSDSFEFEKVDTSSQLPVHSQTQAAGTLPSNSGRVDIWLLSGFFDDSPSWHHAKIQSPIPNSGSLELAVSPNPFNPITTISFELQVASYVELSVYDISGRDVGTAGRHKTDPYAGIYGAGHHSITFDGSDLPSGVYFVRLEAGETVQTKKMVLVK